VLAVVRFAALGVLAGAARRAGLGVQAHGVEAVVVALAADEPRAVQPGRDGTEHADERGMLELAAQLGVAAGAALNEIADRVDLHELAPWDK
jgi:hypothetical protein